MALLRRKNRKKRPLGKRLSELASSTVSHLRSLLRLVVAVVIIAALPIGIYHGYHALMRSDYFRVSAIRLDGNHRVTRAEVLEIAGLDQPTVIFSVDTEQIRTRLLENPWIVDAEVFRDLPRTVRINVLEREPAGWLYWDELYRVDAEGLIIEPGAPGDVNGAVITGIAPLDPEFDTGESAARIREALTVANFYHTHGLNRFDELDQIHVDDLVGISLLTKQHGMEVRLGHDRYAERLLKLRDVLETLGREDLRGRYVLLDGEGNLTRVAVGPAQPGRGESGPFGRNAQ